MSARVLFVRGPVETPVEQWDSTFTTRLDRGVRSFADKAGLVPRAVRVPLGSPGEAAAAPVPWLETIKRAATGNRYFENLSITTTGLHTAEGLRTRAKGLGLESFQVGDDPEVAAGTALDTGDDSSLGGVTLAAGADVEGLAVTHTVRPFAHTGFSGAVFQLGCGILDMQSKLRLHRSVRPSVDTPLCAGCGSCLAVCIFDAIRIQGGRASIDHKMCTGCGECMTACHLAGIAPREGGGVPLFQRQVAEAASAVGRHFGGSGAGKLLFVSFLLPITRRDRGGFNRSQAKPGSFGALIGSDPVALDQACWDLLAKDSVQGLREWSGFLTEPGPMLERAEQLGLGRREYRLDES